MLYHTYFGFLVIWSLYFNNTCICITSAVITEELIVKFLLWMYGLCMITIATIGSIVWVIICLQQVWMRILGLFYDGNYVNSITIGAKVYGCYRQYYLFDSMESSVILLCCFIGMFSFGVQLVFFWQMYFGYSVTWYLLCVAHFHYVLSMVQYLVFLQVLSLMFTFFWSKISEILGKSQFCWIL